MGKPGIRFTFSSNTKHATSDTFLAVHVVSLLAHKNSHQGSFSCLVFVSNTSKLAELFFYDLPLIPGQTLITESHRLLGALARDEHDIADFSQL